MSLTWHVAYLNQHISPPLQQGCYGFTLASCMRNRQVEQGKCSSAGTSNSVRIRNERSVHWWLSVLELQVCFVLQVHELPAQDIGYACVSIALAYVVMHPLSSTGNPYQEWSCCKNSAEPMNTAWITGSASYQCCWRR